MRADDAPSPHRSCANRPRCRRAVVASRDATVAPCAWASRCTRWRRRGPHSCNWPPRRRFRCRSFGLPVQPPVSLEAPCRRRCSGRVEDGAFIRIQGRMQLDILHFSFIIFILRNARADGMEGWPPAPGSLPAHGRAPSRAGTPSTRCGDELSVIIHPVELVITFVGEWQATRCIHGNGTAPIRKGDRTARCRHHRPHPPHPWAKGDVGLCLAGKLYGVATINTSSAK